MFYNMLAEGSGSIGMGLFLLKSALEGPGGGGRVVLGVLYHCPSNVS